MIRAQVPGAREERGEPAGRKALTARVTGVAGEEFRSSAEERAKPS